MVSFSCFLKGRKKERKKVYSSGSAPVKIAKSKCLAVDCLLVGDSLLEKLLTYVGARCHCLLLSSAQGKGVYKY